MLILSFSTLHLAQRNDEKKWFIRSAVWQTDVRKLAHYHVRGTPAALENCTHRDFFSFIFRIRHEYKCIKCAWVHLRGLNSLIRFFLFKSIHIRACWLFSCYSLKFVKTAFTFFSQNKKAKSINREGLFFGTKYVPRVKNIHYEKLCSFH